MKLGIAHWENRISPVFDVAGLLLIVEISDQEQPVIQSTVEVRLQNGDLRKRAEKLAELKVDVLICGAISRWMEIFLKLKGISVIPLICGEINEIIAAYVSGAPLIPHFRMPGCRQTQGCGHQRRHRRRGKGGKLCQEETELDRQEPDN